MESHIAHSGQWYSVLGWLEKNRKQIIAAVVVLTIIGIVTGFVLWRKEQNEIAAGEALSAVMAAAGPAGVTSDALLKVAREYSGTDAGARALLDGAAQLFIEGKVAEAQEAFQRFLSEYEGSPLTPQAKLGTATCLDALGKSAEATAAFKEVVDRFPGEHTVTQAKFSLARLYEQQGKLEMARDLYMDLARDSRTLYGSEAIGRLTEIFQKNPGLRPGNPAEPAPTASAVVPVQ